MSPKLGIEIRDKIIEVFTKFEDSRVYPEVLDVILSVIESDYGIFGYITENGNLVLPSFTRDVWDKCQIPGKDITFPREEWVKSNGIWARAIIEGKTFYSNQQLNPPEGHIPMNRAIAVPIKYQKKIIGMLAVANKSSDYTKEDIAGLEKFSLYISPILSARLERERQLTELKKLRKKESKKSKKIQLDDIDKQILFQLYLDGRESKPLIAKNLDMSHTGIQNRIKKLNDSNTLKIQGNLNINSLDMRVAYVNIEFINYDSIDKFIEAFTECPRLFIISRITGQYHIKLGVMGKNLDDLNSFINYCLLTDKQLINSTDITFASDISKPEFFPINLFNIHNEDTPCGRTCLKCEAYVNKRCFGCSFL